MKILEVIENFRKTKRSEGESNCVEVAEVVAAKQ